MNDTISRQGLLNRLEEVTGMNTPQWLVDVINETPSVQQWTPAQQNPKRSDWYIVTKRFGNDGELWIGAKWYSTAYGWTGDGVLAWMELPEAYKEGE